MEVLVKASSKISHLYNPLTNSAWCDRHGTRGIVPGEWELREREGQVCHNCLTAQGRAGKFVPKSKS